MDSAGGGYSGYGRGGPARSFEDRAVAKEQMMESIRSSSQQDRRVYVGNLSYDVKWHHLKDFMRQGKCFHCCQVSADPSSWRSTLCRCLNAS